MKIEKKFFDTHYEANKYVKTQEQNGQILLSVKYKKTDFFSFLMGIYGYTYEFIWK